MRSFRQFFPFGTLEVLNWARRRMRCVRFWSAGPAPNLTAMRRPNLTLHRMAVPPRSLVIRESQRAAIGELTVRCTFPFALSSVMNTTTLAQLETRLHRLERQNR